MDTIHIILIFFYLQEMYVHGSIPHKRLPRYHGRCSVLDKSGGDSDKCTEIPLHESVFFGIGPVIDLIAMAAHQKFLINGSFIPYLFVSKLRFTQFQLVSVEVSLPLSTVSPLSIFKQTAWLLRSVFVDKSIFVESAVIPRLVAKFKESMKTSYLKLSQLG